MIVSIDIGTSYSSLSMIGPEGKPVPVTIGEGGTAWGDKFSLPSAVFLEENGNILVGQAAMRSRLRKPDCFRMEFKRNLGEDTPLLLGGRSFRVEELYTELLLHMKACVKKTTGEDIELAYLTCPATYRKDKKERLISAAKAAGLFQVELVPEPTAAAMSYVSAGYVKDGQTLLVYDFGGGTFDAALIQYKDGAFLPLGEPLGLPRCGGIDMDRLIYQDMMKAVDPDTLAILQKKQEHYLRFAGQLSEKAVQIKHQLSSAQTATEYIPMGWDQLEYTLTRQAFEKMIAPMIDQTIHVCEDALTSAGLEKSGLSAVVLVGGTSRVPLVQQMVQQFAGKVPVYAAPDVDLAVVQGALSYRLYNEGETAEKWYQDAKKLEEQDGTPQEVVNQRSTHRVPVANDREHKNPSSQKEVVCGSIVEARAAMLSKARGVAVGAGSRHTVGLRSDGTVIATGDKRYGECEVISWGDIIAVAVGTFHTIGLRSNGKVVATGDIHFGKCDVNSWYNIMAVAAGANHTVGLKRDGTVVVIGDNFFGQCEVNSWYNITAVAAKGCHTVGLRKNGTVVATGINFDGQCNVNTWHDIVAVATGGMHTVGLRSDGTVVATGRTADTQCEVNNWHNIIAVAVGESHTVGLRSDGTVVATGSNYYGQCNVSSWHDIIAVVAGDKHTVGLRSDGTVVATGWNKWGQCNVQSWKLF